MNRDSWSLHDMRQRVFMRQDMAPASQEGYICGIFPNIFHIFDQIFQQSGAEAARPRQHVIQGMSIIFWEKCWWWRSFFFCLLLSYRIPSPKWSPWWIDKSVITTKVMGLQFSVWQLWQAHVVIFEVVDVGQYYLFNYDIGSNNSLVFHVNNDENIVSVQLHDRRHAMGTL